MRIKKIKGSILQYAVVSAILIFFLLLSLILLTHIQSYFSLQSNTFIKQITDVNTAIEKTLLEDISLKSYLNDSVQIDQGYLGGFKKVAASTVIKGTTFTKSALTGTPISSKTLYLENTNRPLVLVGTTTLKGRAFVSPYGIKAGIIAGTYFSGKNLIATPLNTSDTKLPELDDRFRSYTSSLLNRSFLNDKEITILKAVNENSFSNEPALIYDEARIEVVEKVVGNIVIKSDSEIQIYQNANITEATIVAPIVKIKDGFRGTIHIIASDSIIVGKNVILEYPSSLVIVEPVNNEAHFFSAINISEESEVNGNVIYFKNNFNQKQDTNIFIANKAKINGAVYCEGNLELKGTIRGTVFTHQFLAREKGSNYVNHILDGTLIPLELEIQWNGLPLKQEKKGVVKWLY